MKRIPAILCIVVLAVALIAGDAQGRPLYVSLTFDDGLASQWHERAVLDDLGVAATFYVNSGKVGRSGFMTWSQLAELQADGHEIGGHTVDHVDLQTRTAAEQQQQVCDDRRTLQANGLSVAMFAFPFGRLDAALRDVVRACGYASARTTGGLDVPPDCCLYANPIPPLNAWDVRAWQVRLTTPIEEYRAVIELGRDGGGGWIPIVFHDICTGACAGWSSYAVRRDLLEQLIRWIQADPDLRLATVGRVMAIAADATAPVVALTAPADGATVAPGPVALTATAADAVGVDRVEFLVDGRVVGSDATAPYAVTWDATDAGATVRVAARAYDERGNAATSPAHAVTVAGAPGDTTPPTVALGYQSSTVAGILGLLATADDDVAVERVEFLVDGAVVATDATAPYEATWDSASHVGRSAVLAARAYDAAGNHATSATRTVRVVAPSSSLAPVVALVTPAGGTTVRGTVDLAVDVAASPTTVSFVEILVDGASIGIDWGAPFHEYWSTASAAGPTATVVARAVDVFGVAALSPPLTLTIAR